MKGDEIRQRFEHQWSLRKTVEQSWDLVTRFVMPMRGGEFYREYTTEHSVEWNIHRREIFDSTAVDACQNLAASLHGALTTPMVRWFDLQFRADELNKLDSAREWLEDTADRTWAALQESNFNLMASEAYLDIVGFGTAFLIEEATMEEDDVTLESLDFKTCPIRESYFEPDHRGGILRFYRRLEWTALQVMDKFDPGRTGEGNVPEDIREMADSPQGSTERHDVIFCIFDRPDKRSNLKTLETFLPPDQRPFGWKYILRRDGHELGEEGGYYEMPAFIPRWRTTAGSQWGHSPAMVAMGDILTLNDAVSMQLDAFERNIDPPWGVTERGLLSDRDMSPSGLTVLRSKDDMWTLETATRLDWVRLEFTRLQEAIRRAFYVDQLELKESPAMTATEVNTRYELMQRMLGPTLGRLQSDMLDPLIERTVHILYRAGELADLPEDVAALKPELDVEYVGPMARAQKGEKVVAIERWVTLLAQLGGMNEALAELLDHVDTENMPRDLGQMLGVPATSMLGEGEVQQKREARNQQRQQAAQLAMAQQAGEAGQALGGAAEQLGVGGEQAAQSLRVLEGGQSG